MKKECVYILSISAGKGCYRHLKISSKSTLYDLHTEILDCFEFCDDHAHAFFMNNSAWDDECGYYSEFMEDVEHYSSEAKLEYFGLEKGDKFLYIFDFGEEWRFCIKVLQVKDEIIEAPQVIKSVGEAPLQYDYSDEDF